MFIIGIFEKRSRVRGYHQECLGALVALTGIISTPRWWTDSYSCSVLTRSNCRAHLQAHDRGGLLRAYTGEAATNFHCRRARCHFVCVGCTGLCWMSGHSDMSLKREEAACVAAPPNPLVYIWQKCAIDRHLRPPLFAPLPPMQGRPSVLKCLSMAHFFE